VGWLAAAHTVLEEYLVAAGGLRGDAIRRRGSPTTNTAALKQATDGALSLCVTSMLRSRHSNERRE
jgi:hypothetical protein